MCAAVIRERGADAGNGHRLIRVGEVGVGSPDLAVALDFFKRHQGLSGKARRIEGERNLHGARALFGREALL